MKKNKIELIWEVKPDIIVKQIDKRELKQALKNRNNGGEDEMGSGGLWDLAFDETLSYLFYEVGLTDLTNEEHHEYTLLAEEVYDILIENE